MDGDAGGMVESPLPARVVPSMKPVAWWEGRVPAELVGRGFDFVEVVERTRPLEMRCRVVHHGGGCDRSGAAAEQARGGEGLPLSLLSCRGRGGFCGRSAAGGFGTASVANCCRSR